MTARWSRDGFRGLVRSEVALSDITQTHCFCAIAIDHALRMVLSGKWLYFGEDRVNRTGRHWEWMALQPGWNSSFFSTLSPLMCIQFSAKGIIYVIFIYSLNVKFWFVSPYYLRIIQANCLMLNAVQHIRMIKPFWIYIPYLYIILNVNWHHLDWLRHNIQLSPQMSHCLYIFISFAAIDADWRTMCLYLNTIIYKHRVWAMRDFISRY